MQAEAHGFHTCPGMTHRWISHGGITICLAQTGLPGSARANTGGCWRGPLAGESNPYCLRSHGGLSPPSGGPVPGIAQSSPSPPTSPEGSGEETRNPGFGTRWTLYRDHGCRKAGKPPSGGGCHAPSHHRLAGHPVLTQSRAQPWLRPAVPSRGNGKRRGGFRL